MKIKKRKSKTLYLDQILKGVGSEIIGTQWDVASTKVDLMSGCISRSMTPRVWEVTSQLFSVAVCSFLRNGFGTGAPAQVVLDSEQRRYRVTVLPA